MFEPANVQTVVQLEPNCPNSLSNCYSVIAESSTQEVMMSLRRIKPLISNNRQHWNTGVVNQLTSSSQSFKKLKISKDAQGDCVDRNRKKWML